MLIVVSYHTFDRESLILSLHTAGVFFLIPFTFLKLRCSFLTLGKPRLDGASTNARTHPIVRRFMPGHYTVQ